MTHKIYIDNLPEPLIAKDKCLQSTIFYGERFVKDPNSMTYYPTNRINKIEVEIWRSRTTLATTYSVESFLRRLGCAGTHYNVASDKDACNDKDAAEANRTGNKKGKVKMNETKMTLDEMISKLDGAAGRLIVASMKDPVIREAMEMITEVSVQLGEVEEIKYVQYGDGEDE